MKWRAAAVSVVVLAVGFGGYALGQAGDAAPERTADTSTATTTTTTRPTTTTKRPTTTTRPPTTTTVPPTTTTWMPPEDSETTAETYEGPVCGAECTEVAICGYDGCTTTTQPPCRVSTINACDPDEPMQLPTIGCEYLERDSITGKVRCAG
jgi:hypothetical protein